MDICLLTSECSVRSCFTRFVDLTFKSFKSQNGESPFAKEVPSHSLYIKPPRVERTSLYTVQPLLVLMSASFSPE